MSHEMLRREALRLLGLGAIGMGFANDIIGGAAALIRAAIKSPNFVHGSTGWSINKDGSAEFNNLTIRGTFNGTNFIINNSGAFFYSGTPAAGNLIASIAGTAGTDQFGNGYPSGINSQENVFGTSANIFGSNITLSTLSGTKASLTPNALTIGSSSGHQITLTTADGALTIYTHAVSESVASQMLGNVIGSGSSEQTLLVINSGVSTGQADRVSMQLSSANQGATLSAQENFVYDDTLGGGHAYATLSADGFNILAGMISAVQPLTGTVGTPAVNEIWHSLGFVSGAWSSPTGGIFYRLLADGSVQFAGQVQYNQALGGSITAGSTVQFSVSTGTGYTPPWNMQQVVEVIERNGSASTQGLAFITYSTGGTLSVNPFTTGFTSSISIFSLDGLIFPISA